MPLLLLKCTFNADYTPKTIDVVDNKPKVFICGIQMLKGINKVATSRNFQNGTENGFLDREKGFNLLLGKTGKGLDTAYSAEGWKEPTLMPENFYANIPDVQKDIKNNIKSDNYLRGVIRNYLYGEAMPPDEPSGTYADDVKKSEVKEEKSSGENNSRSVVAEENKTSRGTVVKEEKQEDTSTGRGRGTKEAGTGRNIMDDLKNMNDD
jgi:hypothetical protein